MNYKEWGMTYLEEAEKLKERLVPLKRQAKTADNETASQLYRRAALLNDMYLDCLHTGRYLIQSGGKR
ncbi:hypothetical protein [Caproiciproducens galactitolivorans]|uniref:Uncharacterized protein n=1 Tax=Caproiciproducens galactitolivorans TaxID=642589 RepID=A0ABT4BW74_9FIRM|nr:hypothetical protein [Caproiciproducens galactitolivorans]MCY1715146.1 hypothetical protein [Caproiciproducens galactitolivorans]